MALSFSIYIVHLKERFYMVHFNPESFRRVQGNPLPQPTVTPQITQSQIKSPLFGTEAPSPQPTVPPQTDYSLSKTSEKTTSAQEFPDADPDAHTHVRAEAHQAAIEDLDSTKKAAEEYLKARGLDEVHNLKDISQMTPDEIHEELTTYGVTISSSEERNIANLTRARDVRAVHDKGSDDVDGHIGTYIQGQSKYCTVLAHLDNMSDEEIQSMVQTKTDENGQKVYVVTFPSDQGTEGNSVVVTEAELKSGEITVTEGNGEQRTLKDFPKGDADITMITMAYVKRFGSNISDNGAWIFNVENRFAMPGTQQFKDNQFLEDITDYSTLVGRSICFLNEGEIARKGYEVKSLTNEDLSWISNTTERNSASACAGLVTTLSDGRNVCITKNGIILSDGTKIENYHAMSVKGYDAQTKELIISGSEFNNMTQVRVPVELLKFMETAGHEGFPGVDRTPLPPEDAQ